VSTNYITRIKNNQITDSTITSAKLAPNTLTGGVFATNLTLNSNVTILGNLSVAGNTASINSINTYINDPAIIFNNGYSGSLTGYDIGFIVNRNLSTLAGYGAVNTAWVWDENQAAFLAIATSTSTTANNIVTVTNSGFANVQLGNLKANSLTVTTGTITATTGGIQNTPIGSATASTGAFTTLTATTSNPITLNATSGNITTLSAPNFSTGNAVITGAQTYIGSTGTPIANVQATLGTITTLYTTTEYATNFSTANAVITGGYATGLANVYATTAYATNFSSGNVYNISGSAGTLVATNFSSGNVVLTGGYATGLANVYATTAQATNLSSGNVILTGGYADNVAIGANTAATGAFTTLKTSGVTTHNANVVIATTTPTTSTTTGALVVQGGAAFQSNAIFGFGANINTGKNSGNGADFYVSGKSDSTLIWAHAGSSYDGVMIGGSGNVNGFYNGAKLTINSNDSMLLPVGDNSGRPGTPIEGMFRYSYASHAIEWYNGTSWQGASTSFTPVTDQTITADGVNNTFSMSPYGTTAASMVSINGVVQIPTIAYSTFSGNSNIVFSEIPAAGDIIDIRVMTTTSTIGFLQSTTGAYQFAVTDGVGAQVLTGSSGASTVATTTWLAGGQMVSNIANVSVSSANTATTIDTVNNTNYRSAKYLVQATNGANYQIQEALVISNGTTATITAYGTVQTNSNLGVLTATQSGSNTLVQFIATNASTTVRFSTTYLPI